jgi:pSer/pThr/pTyr-binding forkhead associated (FHA) protein
MIQILSHRVRVALEVPLHAAVRQPLPVAALDEIQSGAPAAAIREAILIHPPTGTEFRLAEGRDSTMGRLDRTTRVAPDVDLAGVDAERTLSRRHAKILRKTDGLFLKEEEGVRNGTFVNGARLAPGTEVRLKHGDQIRLGRVELVFSVK